MHFQYLSSLFLPPFQDQLDEASSLGDDDDQVETIVIVIVVVVVVVVAFLYTVLVHSEALGFVVVSFFLPPSFSNI